MCTCMTCSTALSRAISTRCTRSMCWSTSSRRRELLFLRNAFAPLGQNGAAILGLPSLESQPYASPQSKVGHINCKSAPDLKKVLEEFFHNVFMFSMNDEVVHTGFHKMANYVFAVGAGKRN